MKKYSRLLIVRVMQIKTVIINHLMTVRMASIKKSPNNKCQSRYPQIQAWVQGFLGGTRTIQCHKEQFCQYRRHKRCKFDPWVKQIPWKWKWQPIPVFLPGESNGQRGLMGYSPQGLKESDTTEVTNPGEGMGKREPLYTVGNVSWCSHYGKQHGK